MIDDRGQKNSVIGVAPPDLKITFLGNNDCLEFGENVAITGEIHFRGNSQYAVFSGDNNGKVLCYLGRDGCRLAVGRGTHANSLLWANIFEEGDSLTIGDNCLLANVHFRTSDSHKIIDIETGERLNQSSSIIIGNHVWLAQDVLVLKGSNIGDGSIIAARSTVMGDIPPNCIAAGTPARLIRTGVRWEE